jgi:hypothetical protein
MDRNQTSFIPKRELYTKVETPVVYQYSVLSIISFSILALSVVLSVSVFIYQKVLVSRVSKINSELVAKKNAFEPDLIDELIKTDKKIETLKTLLKTKSTVLPVFSMLEESTLETVRFTSLKYFLDSKTGASIDLAGEALSSASVALQSDVLNSYPKILNPDFSSFTISDNGTVKFNFKAGLKKEHFSYSGFIKDEKVGNELDGDKIDDLPSDI